jgi:hypothetical protein
VSFEIDALDGPDPILRLTLRDEGLGPRGPRHNPDWADISEGWSRALSSLKTLLETGHRLPLEDGLPQGDGGVTGSAARRTPRRRP